MALYENLGEVAAYDNLIAGTELPILTRYATASADLTRGTLVTVKSGKAAKATAEAGENYGIIADDAKTNEKVEIYISGLFVRSTVEKATGLELSEAAEEAARKDGIIFKDAV